MESFKQLKIKKSSTSSENSPGFKRSEAPETSDEAPETSPGLKGPVENVEVDIFNFELSKENLQSLLTAYEKRMFVINYELRRRETLYERQVLNIIGKFLELKETEIKENQAKLRRAELRHQDSQSDIFN